MRAAISADCTADPPGAVVVTGGERIFAAGADISEFGGADEARSITEGFHTALDAVAASLPAGRRVGLYHFGLKVGDSDDELRAALAALEENGVAVLGASDHTVTHSLYIADPDGNEIELYIDVPGVDWRTDPTLVMSPVKPLVL